MKPQKSTTSGSSGLTNLHWSTHHVQTTSDWHCCIKHPLQYAQEALARPTEISSGMPAMDQLHYDLFNALDDVSSSKDDEFMVRYGAFLSKVEFVFREEERWMEEIDFPVLCPHREQHARVLGALHNVHFHVMNGDFQLGREVVDKLLPQWLALHISTMDTPLALAMQLARGTNQDIIPLPS